MRKYSNTVTGGPVLLGLALLVCCGGKPGSGTPGESIAGSAAALTTPTGKGGGLARTDAPNTPTAQITYHGGPVMLGTVNVYYIWYGDWSGDTTPSVLTDLAQSIGGSPYFRVNTTYMDGNGNAVGNSVNYAGSTSDPSYSRGKVLTDEDIAQIVSQALTNGSLQTDKDGVYFVITSSDVTETSGFCSAYCGWHANVAINGQDIKISFIGGSANCGNCILQSRNSPNGNPSADAMASVIAHELDESVTDPDLNAWFDEYGNENADKCAWQMGTEYVAANGSGANVHLGSRDYLIQENWVNRGSGFCAMCPALIDCGGAQCGTISDGCGGTLNCGNCGAGQTCSSNMCCPVGLVWNEEVQACSRYAQCPPGTDNCGGYCCACKPPRLHCD